MSAELSITSDDRWLLRSEVLATIEILVVISYCGYFFLSKGQTNYFSTYLLGIVMLVLVAASSGLRSRLLASKVFLTGATLAGYLTLTSLWSAGGTPVTIGKTFSDWLLITTMLAALIVLSFQGQLRVERILFALAVTASLSATYFLYCLWGNASATPWGRISTKSVAAMVYGFAAVLAMNRAVAPQGRFVQAVMVVCAMVLLAGVYFCHANYVWLAIALALCCQIALHLWERRNTRSAYVLLPLLVAVLTAFLYCLSLVLASHRQLIWRPVVTAAFKAHALIGHGILEQAIPRVNCNAADWIRNHFANCFLAHPHNIYISTLFYGGIIGVFLLLLTLLMAFGFAFERNILKERATVLSLLTYGSTVLMFDGNKLLDKIDFTWLLFWLPIGMAAMLELTRQRDD